MQSFVEITDHKIAILDPSGQQTPYVRQQLVAYKKRWNQSLAPHLSIHSSELDIPEGVTIIAPSFNQPQSLHSPVILVDSINQLTHYDLRAAIIKVEVQYTKDPIEAKNLLLALDSTFAFDTETASTISEEDELALKDELQIVIDTYKPVATDTPEEAEEREIQLLRDTQPIRSKLASVALVMCKNQTMMYSFADCEDSAVVIDSNPETDKVVLDFLTQTDSLVIMHNCLYDMRLVYNRTGNFIKNFEDTQLMHATIRNNTNTLKAKVGLKEIAKKVYRDWAVAKDMFSMKYKYNAELIQYSGEDPAATMFAYNEALISFKEETT